MFVQVSPAGAWEAAAASPGLAAEYRAAVEACLAFRRALQAVPALSPLFPKETPP